MNGFIHKSPDCHDLLKSNKLLHEIEDCKNAVKYGDAIYYLGNVEKREIEYNIHKMNGFAKKNASEKLWFAKENSTRKVFINYKVNRISEIDNVNEQYRLKFDIDFIFMPTLNEYLSYLIYSINNNHCMDHWHPISFCPSIQFDNQIDIYTKEWKFTKDIGVFTIQQFGHCGMTCDHKHRNKDQFDIKYTKFIHCGMTCDVTFAEELELQSFPFDCQDLTCIVTDESNCEYLPMIFDENVNFASIDPSCSIMDEWDLESAMLEFGDIQHTDHVKLILRLKMKRRYFAVVTNQMAPMVVLTGLSLSACSLDAEEEITDRLIVLITILLTIVSFHFIIAQELPNVAYLTFIDKYILSAYLFLALNSIETAFGKYIGEENDKYTFKYMLLIWIFYQLFFCIYAIYVRRDETKKLNMNSEEIEEEVNFEKEELHFEYTHCGYIADDDDNTTYIFKAENNNNMQYKCRQEENLNSDFIKKTQ